MKIIGQVAVSPTPGPQIARLTELAYNLWWSWNPAAQSLYEVVDPDLWKQANHNPVKFLRRVGQRKLDRVAADADYLARYRAVMAAFDAYMCPPAGATWYASSRKTSEVSEDFGSLANAGAGLRPSAGGHPRRDSARPGS